MILIAVCHLIILITVYHLLILITVCHLIILTTGCHLIILITVCHIIILITVYHLIILITAVYGTATGSTYSSWRPLTPNNDGDRLLSMNEPRRRDKDVRGSVERGQPAPGAHHVRHHRPVRLHRRAWGPERSCVSSSGLRTHCVCPFSYSTSMPFLFACYVFFMGRFFYGTISIIRVSVLIF